MHTTAHLLYPTAMLLYHKLASTLNMAFATLPALRLHRLDLPSWLKQLACPLCPGVAQMSLCLTRSARATFLLMSIEGRVCTQWRTPWPVATGFSILACSRPPGVVEEKAFARYAPNYMLHLHESIMSVHHVHMDISNRCNNVSIELQLMVKGSVS